MKCEVTKFKVEDFDEIEMREESRGTLEAMKKELALYKEIYTGGMPFFTCRINGKIIVIYGIAYMGCGSYCPGLLASKYISKHLKTVMKLFYDYYATYVPRSARRMEAHCDIMDPKAIRFAEYFGFNTIGIKHHSSPEGHDQVILERLVNLDPRKVEKLYGR